MPVISSLALLLGPAIAKSILKFWLKSTWAEEIPRDIVDYLKKQTEDVIAQQKGKRQFEAIGEKVAESLLPLFESEQANFSEERKEELVKILTDTLEKAELTPEILTARNLEPTALAKFLLEFQPQSVKDFSEAEREFFHRAISETSRSIVDIATQLPSFNERTFAEILKREMHLIQITTEILDEVRRIREQSQQENVEIVAAKFEEDYLLSVIRRLDELQLFGVDVSRASKRHKLSVAYVTLSVEQKTAQVTPLAGKSEIKDNEGDDESDLRAISPVDRVLAASRRLLIRGGAGSGKTTLMQWIAVNSAGRKFTDALTEWNNTIPFYIRLREFVEKQLPAPEHFPKLIASTISAEMPAHWAHEKLRSGQAIVLIDGVDELPETRRDDVRQWVDELTGNFKDSRFIITSRPSAIEEGWLTNEGFADAELQPMQLPDIITFIDHWHAAVREELSDGEEKSELSTLAEALKIEIRRSKQKRELATSPLLCAMLCALHRDRKRQLPSDRVQLYEACIEMLIERRDLERGVKLQDFPDLGYRQKRVLLEDLAYWMLKNNWPDVEWDQAKERIEKNLQNMHGLPANTTTEKVLALLVERSGVIREPVPEHIDFTHKTFQEFLAAQSLINEGDIGLLIENAHKDLWREVVILAAGLTKKESEREEIIHELLFRGDRETDHRYQLHLLAVACLENSVSLSPELRSRVEERLEKLLPPRDIANAKDLASAGELAVPFLERYVKAEDHIVNYCIYALALIGGEQALDALERYAKDANLTVSQALINAWQRSDWQEEDGRRILSRIWNGKVSLELRGVTSLKGFPSIITLETLDLSGCSQLVDLRWLPSLPNLKMVDLSGCQQLVDVSGLSNFPNLTTLDLRWCIQLMDISGLSNLPNLTTLDLSWCDKLTNLRGLSNLPNLTKLNLRECKQLVTVSGLSNLPNLTTLGLSWCEQLRNISGLSNLPNLKILDLRGCDRLMDLGILGYLSSLSNLEVIYVSKGFKDVPAALKGKIKLAF